MSLPRFIKQVQQAGINFNEVQALADLGSRDCLDSLNLAKTFPHARVYSFECSPKNFATCQKNLLDAPPDLVSRVTFSPLAIHKINGPILFYPVLGQNNGASSIFPKSGKYDHVENYPMGQPIEIQATRLDTWLEERKLHPPEIIWADLQVAELYALEGLGDCIQAVKALYLEVEYKEMYLGQPLFPEVHEFLLAHGFRLVWQEPPRFDFWGNVVYIRP